MIKLESKKLGYSVLLHENVNDVKKEELIKLSEKVILPRGRCLIALVTTVNLYDLAMSVNNTQINGKVKVNPFYVKGNTEDLQYSPMAGDHIVMGRSEIEMAQHVFISENKASSSFVGNVLSKDIDLRASITTGTFDKTSEKTFVLHNKKRSSPDVCIIEFKVTDLGHIKAWIDSNIKTDDMYIEKLIESPNTSTGK